MMIDVNEYPCPDCGYEGPHITIDDSALECGNCCESIDIRDYTADPSYLGYTGGLEE